METNCEKIILFKPLLHNEPVRPGGHVQPYSFVHINNPRHISLAYIEHTPLQSAP